MTCSVMRLFWLALPFLNLTSHSQETCRPSVLNLWGCDATWWRGISCQVPYISDIYIMTPYSSKPYSYEVTVIILQLGGVTTT